MQMRFKDYIDTPFLPAILPTIPFGAQLGPNTSLTPDKIGKIPGRRHPSGWVGMANWQSHKTTAAVTVAYQEWYHDEPCATIGTQAEFVPAVDSDVPDEKAADIVYFASIKHLGFAPKRGRPNSAKFALMFKLKEGAAPITKRRLSFKKPGSDEVMAVEVLAKGQHYLIDGMHPSGVQYEWDCHPLEFGHENLTEIDNPMVDVFLKAVADDLVKAGYELIKACFSMGANTTARRRMTRPNHPDVCPSYPDLQVLADLLEHCPCDADEFASRDDWIKALVAIKVACVGNDEFYEEHVWPWCTAYPDNTYEYVRERWESIRDGALGWSYLVSVAQGFGWIEPGGFDALPDGEGQAATPTPTIEPDETVIADEFVKRHAQKNWVFTPHGQSGTWRRCECGIWVEDNHSITGDVSRLCAHVGTAIRRNPNANQTALRLARSLHGAHAANAVMRLVRSNRSMFIADNRFDSIPWLVGVPGGYIDESNVLHESDPSLMITRCLTVRPDFDAKSPLFDARLMLMCGVTI